MLPSDPSRPEPTVLSVNTGPIRSVEWCGRTVRTAIWKTPVAGPIDVRGVNLDGDDQADRRVHGGTDKAVYSYAIEDYAWWRQHWSDDLAPVVPGLFGENLTLSGLAIADATIGDRWHIGTTVLEVAQPRTPCFKLGMRVGDAAFLSLFAGAGRPGAYLRVVTEGALQAGDEVRVEPTNDSSFTIGDLVADDPSPEFLRKAAASPTLAEEWRREARRALKHL